MFRSALDLVFFCLVKEAIFFCGLIIFLSFICLNFKDFKKMYSQDKLSEYPFIINLGKRFKKLICIYGSISFSLKMIVGVDTIRIDIKGVDFLENLFYVAIGQASITFLFVVMLFLIYKVAFLQYKIKTFYGYEE